MLLAMAVVSPAMTALAEKPVNFVVIYLDDMGMGDLSITGASGYQTPHIDQMAREGVRFTHFYSPQAVCSASRAGLLTGCYPNRVGFSGALDHRAQTGINPEEETLAEVLKKYPPRVTRIATGVPVGGDLKYLDEVTLRRAMERRESL